ncbi:MAG TPA: hypothetical protein VJ249_03795 [Candidatus Bathyarchaeia archaeon]|nr:hypothetical protein [Candidatus Bathyarchaeia archaeon]
MKVKSKAEMAADLNRFLLVENVSWEKLPKKDLAEQLNRFLLIQVSWERLSQKDLIKVCSAFQRLRQDVDEILALLDQAPFSTESPQKTIEKMVQYVI